MKLSMYSGLFHERTLDEYFWAAHRYGYDGVEIRTNHSANIPLDITPEEKERVKALLASSDLEFPHLYGCGGGYAMLSDEECEQQLEQLARFADIAEYFGCSYICQGPGGNSPDLPDEIFERAAHWLRRGADLVADKGLKLVSEIHNNGLIEKAETAVKLGEMVNRDNFGFIYDPANMMICGWEWKGPVVEMLGEKIFWVHVKDMGPALPDDPRKIKVKEALWQYNLLGDGACRFEDIFADLRNIGYDGWLSFECNMPCPGEVVAEHEIKVARRMLGRGEGCKG